MRFDNSSVQYAEIPSSPSLEWSDSYVTLCAWVNITSVPEVGFSLPSYHQTIVGKIGSSQSDSSWDLAFGDNWPQQQPAGASDDTYYKPRVNTDGTAAWVDPKNQLIVLAFTQSPSGNKLRDRFFKLVQLAIE